MIFLSEEDKTLLAKMEGEISKSRMQENWEKFMEYTPIHSGSQNEVKATNFLKERLEAYGLEPEILFYDAYISDPQWAKLEVMKPVEMEVICTPYRQVGTKGPEWIEGRVIYVPPEDIGSVDCEGKIVLAEQQTAGDWMGARARGPWV